MLSDPPAASTAAPLAERLREETRPQHEAIEASLSILMSPNLTRDAYTRVVERFYGFFAGWEPRAAETLPAGELREMFNARRKADRLADDLRSLGYDEAALSRIPLCAGSDSVCTDTSAHVLGTMYVTEGSTLGGQIISKHLERQLGLSDNRGYAYFRGAGPLTATRWREFKGLLDAHATPANDAIIIRAAADTFDKMRLWICG